MTDAVRIKGCKQQNMNEGAVLTARKVESFFPRIATELYQ